MAGPLRATGLLAHLGAADAGAVCATLLSSPRPRGGDPARGIDRRLLARPGRTARHALGRRAVTARPRRQLQHPSRDRAGPPAARPIWPGLHRRPHGLRHARNLPSGGTAGTVPCVRSRDGNPVHDLRPRPRSRGPVRAGARPGHRGHARPSLSFPGDSPMSAPGGGALRPSPRTPSGRALAIASPTEDHRTVQLTTARSVERPPPAPLTAPRSHWSICTRSPP